MFSTLSSNTANPFPARPILSPLQTNDKNIPITATTSNTTRTITPPVSTKSVSNSIPAVATNSLTGQLSQFQQPQQRHTKHQHNNSSSSTSTTSSLTSMLRAKRSRAYSQGTANATNFTPITPPPMLTSPIITFSENLQSTKATLNNIEQNYFDCLAAAQNQTHNQNQNQCQTTQGQGHVSSSIASTPATTAKSTRTSSAVSMSKYASSVGQSCTTTSTNHQQQQQQQHQHDPSTQVNSIEEMTTIEDLLQYSNFLASQKQSIDDVFQKTKEKMGASGWCSQYDLHNLQLQQDSSRCQIDTLILRIEERLNRDFDYSMLNNESQ